MKRGRILTSVICLFLTLNLFTLNAQETKKPQTSPDSLVLVKIYNEMGGPNWTYQRDWLSKESINHWIGITGDFLNGVFRVMGIFLSENNLSGSIPRDIGNLSELVNLRLYNNKLIGPVPSEIGNCIKLKEFYLNDNQLSGSIPIEIGNCTKLERLNLSNNKLTGPIPSEITNLINLISLDLNSNQFTQLPDLTNLANSNLKSINIGANKIKSFENIEPLVGIIIPHPQDSVGEAKVYKIKEGDSLTLSVSVGGTANIYRWYKQINTEWYGGSSYTDSNYIIPSVSAHHVGRYLCKISNSIVPNLIFTSRIQTVNLVKTELEVGGLTVYADMIDSTAENSYTVSGNVSINHVVDFSGDLTINTSELKISGTGSVVLNEIPVVGSVTLYEGSFDLNVVEESFNILKSNNYNKLEFGGFKASIDTVVMLSDGIRAAGSLDLPESLGGGGIKIDSLKITKSKGVDFAGQIKVPDFKMRVVEFKDISLSYNTENKEFTGSANIKIPIVELGAGLKLLNGELDSVSITIGLGKAVPIASTGFFLEGGGGSLSNFSSQSSDPVKINLFVNITGGPPIAGNSLIRFERAGVLIQPNDIFKAQSNFELLNIPVSSGEIGYEKGGFELTGKAKIPKENTIIDGEMKIRVGSSSASGNVNGKIIIPSFEPEGFVDRILKKLITVASKLPKEYSGKLNMVYEYDPGVLRFEGETSFSVTSSQNVKLSFKAEFDPDFNLYFGTNFTGVFQVLKPAYPGKTTVNNIQIPFNAPQVIFSAEGDISPVSFNLIKPDGSKITGSSGGKNRAVFLSNPAENTTFFVVENPEYGTWGVEILEPDGNSVTLSVIGADNPPVIELKTPSDKGQESGLIEWYDSDPDDNARIDLYYDTDNKGFDGTPIAEGLYEDDETDNYTWDFSDVPGGEYYIYARISDGKNPSQYSYSEGTIGMASADAPLKPSGFQILNSTDSTITFQWTEDSYGEIYGYEISGYEIYCCFLCGGEEVVYSEAIGDTGSHTISTIEPGRSYTFTLTAWNTDGYESLKSDPVTFEFTSSSKNNPPYFESVPSSNAVFGTLYRAELDITDADGDPLNLTLYGPTGMILTQSTIEWTPDSVGAFWIKIIADDNNGGKDSLIYYVNVISADQITAVIRANSLSFVNTEDKAVITIDDYDMNTDENKKNEITGNVWSLSDPAGFSLTLKETGDNSAQFKGSFGFDTLAGNPQENILKISDGDTVCFEYEETNPAKVHLLKMVWFTVSPDTTTVGIEDNEVKEDKTYLPNDFYLKQNYPNPFNPETVIEYELPYTSDVNLIIYNILGKEIKTLVSGKKPAGYHSVIWDGRNKNGVKAGSGIYLYKLTAGNFVKTKKMVLLK